jgi:AraC-like DNA-binding protein
MSIKQYINKVRLERAADMLVQNEYSISTIARGVGFEDTNYFIKLFKSTYGCTPGEYRKQHTNA